MKNCARLIQTQTKKKGTKIINKTGSRVQHVTNPVLTPYSFSLSSLSFFFPFPWVLREPDAQQIPIPCFPSSSSSIIHTQNTMVVRLSPHSLPQSLSYSFSHLPINGSRPLLYLQTRRVLASSMNQQPTMLGINRRAVRHWGGRS